MRLLEPFEKDLFKLVEKIQFLKINWEFQGERNPNTKDVKKKVMTGW